MSSPTIRTTRLRYFAAVGLALGEAGYAQTRAPEEPPSLTPVARAGESRKVFRSPPSSTDSTNTLVEGRWRCASQACSVGAVATASEKAAALSERAIHEGWRRQAGAEQS